MKKLTAGIFATLLTMVSVDGAYAAIASKGYVDEQVDTVEATVATKADKSTTLAGYGITDAYTSAKGTALEGRVDVAEGEIDTLQTAVGGKQDALGFTPENSANKTQTVNAQSTDVQYPSAKAVWTAVSSVDANASVEALEGRVGKLETASATHATKTELTDGLAEKLDTATAATTYATKTELSGKQNTIAGAQLEALNSGITADKVEAYDGYAAQISGKLDTATADGKYAAKSTEGVANTASTNAQTAITNIGTLSQLTTEAKNNTVAAINEVAKEAADAQSTATGAQSAVDAVEAKIAGYGDIVSHDASEFATAAQGSKADTAVQPAAISDMLTKTEAGTTYYTKTSGDALAGRVTTAEGEIDAIQAEMDTMATSETVTNLTNRVTTAEGDITALETAVNDAESGLAATNAIADEALANAATAQSAAEAAQRTADAKQDKLTGTIGGSMQPVYLNNGTITAGTALGTLATKSTVTNSEVADGALAQTKINGLATALAAKLTTPPTTQKGEDGLYVLTYDGTDFQWEDIARTVAE